MHRPARLIIVLALLGLALPAAALAVRVTIHFKATFDTDSSTSNSFPAAEVGNFQQTSGSGGDFKIVAAPDEGGWLRISGSGDPAALQAGLNPPFVGSEVLLSWSEQASQTSASLRMSIADDSDSGMIDLTFDDDGWIYVDELAITTYEIDTLYDVELMLLDPMMGASTWNLMVSWEGASGAEVVYASGPLELLGALHVTAIEVIRESTVAPAEFFLDDLKVLSEAHGLK